MLNTIDDFTGGAAAIKADRTIYADRLVALLERLLANEWFPSRR